MICHSEFISESNDSNDLATLEIPKQVRDDNCDTVCFLAGLSDDLFGGSVHIYVCDGGGYAILIRKYSLLTDKLYGDHLKPVNQGLE